MLIQNHKRYFMILDGEALFESGGIFPLQNAWNCSKDASVVRTYRMRARLNCLCSFHSSSLHNCLFASSFFAPGKLHWRSAVDGGVHRGPERRGATIGKLGFSPGVALDSVCKELDLKSGVPYHSVSSIGAQATACAAALS